MTLLSALIAGLTGTPAPRPPREDFAEPDRPKRRYHRPPPEHMRHAIAAHRAQVEAECARIDQAVLDACQAGPRAVIDIASELHISQKRARNAARRLEAAGRARAVAVPCEGRADVIGLEASDA